MCWSIHFQTNARMGTPLSSHRPFMTFKDLLRTHGGFLQQRFGFSIHRRGTRSTRLSNCGNYKPHFAAEIQQGQLLAAIEVKASATVTQRDFMGLRKLKDACGEQFSAGVVLYDGESVLPFGGRLHAVPLSLLVHGEPS